MWITINCCYLLKECELSADCTSGMNLLPWAWACHGLLNVFQALNANILTVPRAWIIETINMNTVTMPRTYIVHEKLDLVKNILTMPWTRACLDSNHNLTSSFGKVIFLIGATNLLYLSRRSWNLQQAKYS